MTPAPFVNRNNFVGAKYDSIASLLNVIVPNLILLAGVIVFLLVIYIGYLYMRSDGSADALKKIKSLLYSTIIGLAIIICSFVLAKILGGIFQFRILPF